MIPLSSAALCLDCRLVDRPDVHGKCPFCGSQALFYLSKILEKKQPEAVKA